MSRTKDNFSFILLDGCGVSSIELNGSLNHEWRICCIGTAGIYRISCICIGICNSRPIIYGSLKSLKKEGSSQSCSWWAVAAVYYLHGIPSVRPSIVRIELTEFGETWINFINYFFKKRCDVKHFNTHLSLIE